MEAENQEEMTNTDLPVKFDCSSSFCLPDTHHKWSN